MKKTGKLLVILLAFLLVIPLAACGGCGGEGNPEEELERGFAAMEREEALKSKVLEELTAAIEAETVSPDANGCYLFKGDKYYKATAVNSYGKLPDGGDLTEGKDYFFTVEPLAWRVLAEQSGKALLVSEKILDAQAFQPEITKFTNGDGNKIPQNEYYKITGTDEYATDWSRSVMRTWLNGTFMDNAFDTAEKVAVAATTVQNGLSTVEQCTTDEIVRDMYMMWIAAFSSRTVETAKQAMIDDNQNMDLFDVNKISAANTQDKVFLLSYSEAQTPGYFLDDNARAAQRTDYAAVKGADGYVTDGTAESGVWSLRSPNLYGGLGSRVIQQVQQSGDVYGGATVDDARGGVRPALWLDLSKTETFVRDGKTVYFGSYPQQVLAANYIKVTDEWKDALDFYTDGNAVQVAGRAGSTATQIEIPAEYKGKPVTRIRANAFKNFANLESVTIPESVETVGTDAFAGCPKLIKISNEKENGAITFLRDSYNSNQKLKSFAIPDSVTEIGKSAFERFYKLEKVTIPDTVTSVASNAFYACHSLLYETYGNLEYINNVLIGSNALRRLTSDDDFRRECESITSITLKPTTTVITPGAFELFSSITSVTIPSSVKTIGSRAFYALTNLTNITIPSSVMSIGESAFYYCTGLTSVTFESGSRLVSIDKSAFDYCTSLTNITIPSSVTSIGESAFENCRGLASVTFASGSQLKSIGKNAFSYCNKLTSITIPDSVIYISPTAFNNTGIPVTDRPVRGLEKLQQMSFSFNKATQILSWEAVAGVKPTESYSVELLVNGVRKGIINTAGTSWNLSEYSLAVAENAGTVRGVAWGGNSETKQDSEVFFVIDNSEG